MSVKYKEDPTQKDVNELAKELHSMALSIYMGASAKWGR